MNLQIVKRIRCWMKGIPFRIKNEWYNYAAMSKKNNHINIFDRNGKYMVPLQNNIVEYVFLDKRITGYYRITGIISDNKNKDWLYDYDWINVDLEFVGLKNI